MSEESDYDAALLMVLDAMRYVAAARGVSPGDPKYPQLSDAERFLASAEELPDIFTFPQK